MANKRNKIMPLTKQLTSSKLTSSKLSSAELQKKDKQKDLRNIPLIDYMVLNAIKKSNTKIERLPLYEESSVTQIKFLMR